MIPFARHPDGIHLTLTPGERAVLASLVEQLEQILQGDTAADPVAARMFPSAYPQDDEAAAEFRRYTFDDLRAAKIENARIVHDWLTGDVDGPLDRTDEQAWLRCLTDLRLTVADRLGIVDVDPYELGELDPDHPDARGLGLRDVYDWLGGVQEHLVMALEHRVD